MAKTNSPFPQAAANAPDADDPKSAPIEVRPQIEGDKAAFDVIHNGTTKRVVAANEREAWALFCDGMKSWPSPKSGTVVKVAA